jgi:hypothetical protein
MTSTSPLLTLNNGVQIPAIGLGVFQSPPEQTVTAVRSAIAQGYRLVDTAASYANERQVGEGVRQSGISRDDMFIETKVWISDYGYEATLDAFDKSAGKLGVDRLDLLLLHQPLPSRFDCASVRQVGRSGDAPMAPALPAVRNSEVDEADSHRRELRRLRLPTLQRPNRRNRRARDWRQKWAGARHHYPRHVRQADSRSVTMNTGNTPE